MWGSIFPVEKPIIGMVHLAHLSGQQKFRGLEYVVRRAVRDAGALERGGVDGICIENWEDETFGPFVAPEMARNIEYVVERVIAATHLPVGVNILPNDYRNAFLVASRHEIHFVWLDVFVDPVRTAYDYSSASPFEIRVDVRDVELCRRLAPAALLFASIHPKHYELIEERPIEESAEEARYCGADAVVITKATGYAPDVEIFKRVRQRIENFPVFQGSGFTAENAPLFLPHIDGVIVGTALKTTNFSHVVEVKVRLVMDAVAKIR